MLEENKALARRVIKEVWNQGNLALIDKLFAADYVGSAPPEHIRGAAGYRELVTKYRAAFPDLRMTIRDLLAEGDKVVIRLSWKGTHRSDLPGIPATGRQAEVTTTVVCRISGGKIVEEWTNWDALGMMQQLGVIPELGQAKAAAVAGAFKQTRPARRGGRLTPR